MTSHWNVAGALHSPNGITTHTKVPQGVVNAVLCTYPNAIAIWLYPTYPSMKVYLAWPPTSSNNKVMIVISFHV